MFLLGLHIGLDGVCARVFSEDFECVAEARKRYTLKQPELGWAELDPYEVWAKSRQSIAAAAEEVSPGEIRALGLSDPGVTMLPVDEKGGPLGRSIVAVDSESPEFLENWLSNQDLAEVFRITGQIPSGSGAAASLMWLRQHNEEACDRAVQFLPLSAFIQTQMGVQSSVDYSLAARSMLFDIHRKCYSEKLYESLGIAEEHFPRVVPPGHVAGTLGPGVAEKLSLPEGCVVSAGSLDLATSILGCGGARSGMAVSSPEMGGKFAVMTEQPQVGETMLDEGVACFPHVIPDRFLSVCSVWSDTSCVDWIRHVMRNGGEEDDLSSGAADLGAVFSHAASAPTDMLAVPGSGRAGGHRDDKGFPGALVGLTLSTSRDELLRALMEGLCYEIRLEISVLREAGVEVDEFRGDALGMGSDIWLQLNADVFRCEVTTAPEGDAAALGSALVAGEAAGVYECASEPAADIAKGLRRFQTGSPDADYYDVMFDRYCAFGSAYEKWISDTHLTGEEDENQ